MHMKKPIEWRSAFNTGIASVDHEHRELVELVNKIHAQLREGSPAELVEARLGELHDSIAAHFALEERIMRDCKYAGYEPHKEDHERLLDDIRDIMESQTADPAAVLAERLAAWFGVHFSTLDAEFHRLMDHR